jgi:hypothetical protein
MPTVKEVSNASSNQSDSSIMRKPSKFTGSHYMPENSIPPSLSDAASPFESPSPHFSPYSHPNNAQGSDMSLSNPFRHKIDDSRISMDLLNNNNGSPSNSKDHALSTLSSSPSFGPVDKLNSPPIVATAVPSAPVHPSAFGPDLRVSRSQNFSRVPSTLSNNISSHDGNSLSPAAHTGHQQTQIRSAPLPFVGSRSPPPPPTMYSDRIVPPKMAYNQNNRMSSAGVLAPSMSLDSLIDYSTNSQRNSAVVTDSALANHPTSPPLRPSSSLGAPLVIQSGAERLPSLTVPLRQSMLRHSASVPQLVDPSSTPVQRNLPAGFASSPVTIATKRS